MQDEDESNRLRAEIERLEGMIEGLALLLAHPMKAIDALLDDPDSAQRLIETGLKGVRRELADADMDPRQMGLVEALEMVRDKLAPLPQGPSGAGAG